MNVFLDGWNYKATIYKVFCVYFFRCLFLRSFLKLHIGRGHSCPILVELLYRFGGVLCSGFGIVPLHPNQVSMVLPGSRLNSLVSGLTEDRYFAIRFQELLPSLSSYSLFFFCSSVNWGRFFFFFLASAMYFLS